MAYFHFSPRATIFSVAALFTALVVKTDVRAQTIGHEPTAAEVAALLRSQGYASGVLAVLTQARGSKPRQMMDEIADSLAAIAVGSSRNDPHGITMASEALVTLLKAGLGRSGVSGVDHGVPYAGAASRLMRVAETAEHVAVRGSALWCLTRLPDRTRLLPFLRKLATSQNGVAEKAVVLLGNETGPEGQAVARALYREGAITEPTARETMAQLAQAYRWR